MRSLCSSHTTDRTYTTTLHTVNFLGDFGPALDSAVSGSPRPLYTQKYLMNILEVDHHQSNMSVNFSQSIEILTAFEFWVLLDL